MAVHSLNFRGMLEYLAKEEGTARRPTWGAGEVILCSSEYRPTIDDMLAKDWIYTRMGAPEIFICWADPVCGQQGNTTDDPALVTCPECREFVESGGHPKEPTQLDQIWAIVEWIKDTTERTAALTRCLGDTQALLFNRIYVILHDEQTPNIPAPARCSLDNHRVFWDKGEFCTTRQLLTCETPSGPFYWCHHNQAWKAGTGDKVQDAMRALDTFPGYRKTWD